jgi:hypothetical protein
MTVPGLTITSASFQQCHQRESTGPEQAIGIGEALVLRRSVQHRQLMPEGEVLKHEVAAATECAEERGNHGEHEVGHGGSA